MTTADADRDKADHYFLILDFDSYEEAMRNSELPETQALAADMAKLGSGPPTFHNLDVVDRWEPCAGPRLSRYFLGGMLWA